MYLGVIMSKLPTSGSRLQMPKAIRPTAMKRNASDDSINSPPKKTRLSTAKFAGEMNRPAGTGTNSQGGMKRSVSLASLSLGAQKDRPKSALSRSRLGSSTQSVTGRPSNVSSSVLANRVPGSTLGVTGRPSNVSSSILANRVPVGSNTRRPGANITNHINSRVTTTNPKVATSTGSKICDAEPEIKGKTKRPGWDLKGRLQDMESLLKSSELARKNYVMKFKEYDQRIESLEGEKTNLNVNLEKTTNVVQANQEEVDRLNRALREEREGRSSEKRNFESELQSLGFAKSSLERQNKDLDAELRVRQQEVSGLKTTVAQVTSAQVGIEAQLSSTKYLLEDYKRRVKEMECQLSNQKETIEDLERKLQEGEIMRRKLHNTVQELKGNIRVYCRVRPLIGEEIKNNGDTDVIHHINFLDERTLEVGKGDANGSSMSGLKGRGNNSCEFAYDKVFNPAATQAEIFEEISQLSQSALDGYNVCIFAYGQTGSGKTFTMEGVHGDQEQEGMIPRTVRHIFKAMKELQDKGWIYKLEASFLEIYNETIRDLLVSSKEAKSLTYDVKFQDNKKHDVYVTNLKIVPVDDERKVQTLLTMAQQQRAVAATNMNERSSRSHSVFTLKLTGENMKTTECCEGMLNLVDLAGSERLKESKSEGARLTETQNINRSLADLSNVIMAIGQKQSHIPYRNSKLTQLLQNSLGGNSKTLMFVNVSPLEACMNETLNSLRFATKVNQCHIGTAAKQVKK